MGCGAPIIKIADDGNKLRVRSPHGKLHATKPIPLAQMSAQLFVRTVMRTLSEQVQIEFTQFGLQGDTSSMSERPRLRLTDSFKGNNRNLVPCVPSDVSAEYEPAGFPVIVPSSSSGLAKEIALRRADHEPQRHDLD